jgi:phage tail sheath gpL-like
VLGAVCEASGSIDPARPFQTLVLPGLQPPALADRFTRQERDLLLRDGISTYTVDQGGNVLVERVITTYQTNAFAIDDVSYLDLETKWTVDYMRYAFRARIALRFPRHKLADNGTSFAPGQNVATPNVIRAELLDVARQLELAGILEGFGQFKDDLVVVRSTVDPGRVNCILPPNVVNQFRVFAASVQFIL